MAGKISQISHKSQPSLRQKPRPRDGSRHDLRYRPGFRRPLRWHRVPGCRRPSAVPANARPTRGRADHRRASPAPRGTSSRRGGNRSRLAIRHHLSGLPRPPLARLSRPAALRLRRSACPSSAGRRSGANRPCPRLPVRLVPGVAPTRGIAVRHPPRPPRSKGRGGDVLARSHTVPLRRRSSPLRLDRPLRFGVRVRLVRGLASRAEKASMTGSVAKGRRA